MNLLIYILYYFFYLKLNLFYNRSLYFIFFHKLKLFKNLKKKKYKNLNIGIVYKIFYFSKKYISINKKFLFLNF
jgi:hypothetical protein